MMSPGRRIQLHDITQEIARDCEADTDRREGQEFTGRNVAAALGEISAMIAVLSQVVGEILQEQQA